MQKVFERMSDEKGMRDKVPTEHIYHLPAAKTLAVDIHESAPWSVMTKSNITFLKMSTQTDLAAVSGSRHAESRASDPIKPYLQLLGSIRDP